MIYLKNNTETQAIYIPRQTVLGGGYISTTEKYEEAYNNGLEDGKEQQKSKLESINITENGQYEREDGWNVVTVDLPDLNGSYEQGKTDGANEQKSKLESINITENGTYSKEDGYNHIEVNVPDLNGSYDEGKTDGINEQKSKLETINITENGVYSKEDGYNHIEVNVPDLNGSYDEGYRQGHTEGYAEGNGVGYNQGRIDGIDEQKGKLSQITISENGTYTKEDGYSEVVVNVPDLNGDYNEGYNQGKIDGVNEQKGKLTQIKISKNGTYTKEDGYSRVIVNVPDLNGSYDEGKTDGVNEQKSKLETINITANGTYTKEDGYNKIIVEVPNSSGDYNKGYEQGQADVAANARVLNVTKNGVYRTKFSDPIAPTLVTGVYADGTEFHNYAELNGKVFNTKIAGSVDSRLEFWYKGDDTLLSDDTYNLIIGAGLNNNKKNCFQVRYHKTNRRLYANIGVSAKTVDNWDNTVWHHLIVSKAEGLWIDGEKKGDFSTSNLIKGEFFINGISYDFNKNANGTFGMIKIDDVVFIPTADGFLNTNTGELLEVMRDGAYNFTENLPIYGEGELYKTINVNVPQKTAQEQSFGYDITAFTYKVYDWTSVTINKDNMTNDCGDRPLDCLLFRNRSGECTVMTKIDTCSGVVRLENGWNSDNIILSLKSNTITKFSSNSINSNQLTSIDTGFARLEGNAITNCNALTDIKVTVLNDNLSTQFATNCFNGLPAEGTITIGKNVDVTITDNEITSFFRTIVGEGWTITIK